LLCECWDLELVARVFGGTLAEAAAKAGLITGDDRLDALGL
jgi:hypothetical protein